MIPQIDEKKEVTVEHMKDEDVEPLPYWQYCIIYVVVLLCILGIIIYTIIEKPNNLKFFGKKGIKIGFILLTYFLNGKFLVEKLELKINYTRKINHFTIWVSPFIIDMIIESKGSLVASLWNITFAFLGFVILTIPFRRSDPTGILNTMFSSLDRPEDRPNTLLWLTIQNFFTALSLFPFILLWEYWDTAEYMYIPLMIGTFGDGFAEVIGVRFGKHKYETYACCSDKKYTRSFEGSSCVFITSIIMIASFNYNFTTLELILNLILIPPLVTLTEAYAPHTLDNPFIIVVSSGILSVIHLLTMV